MHRAKVVDIGDINADLLAHQQRTAGAVAALAAGLLGVRDPMALDCARTLGALHGVARTLAEAGADVRAGRIYLPADELAQFGLAERDLLELEGDDRDAWRRFMAHQIERLSGLYDEVLATVSANSRQALLPDLILASLQRALLAEIRASRYRVLSQRVALTPLRRLWIAWRTRRRTGRSKPVARLG